MPFSISYRFLNYGPTKQYYPPGEFSTQNPPFTHRVIHCVGERKPALDSRTIPQLFSMPELERFSQSS